MGLIGRLAGQGGLEGVTRAATAVAEVFRPNATSKMEAAHRAYMAALAELGVEFRQPASSWFDRLINGLNRLPRPLMAFGTLGLFVYAMADPVGFVRRMAGLNHVPEPLWWLLAAIVGFYFGAREAHYFRSPAPAPAPPPPDRTGPARDDGDNGRSAPRDDNPALREISRGRDR